MRMCTTSRIGGGHRQRRCLHGKELSFRTHRIALGLLAKTICVPQAAEHVQVDELPEVQGLLQQVVEGAGRDLGKGGVVGDEHGELVLRDGVGQRPGKVCKRSDERVNNELQVEQTRRHASGNVGRCIKASVE